jgi:hypothetical protein
LGSAAAVVEAIKRKKATGPRLLLPSMYHGTLLNMGQEFKSKNVLLQAESEAGSYCSSLSQARRKRRVRQIEVESMISWNAQQRIT